MRRRDFIAGVAGSTAAWPVAARAQRGERLPIIGFLGPASASAMRSWTDAFVGRLRELGWIEGRTVAIEFRWAEGRSDHFAEVAAEFVRLQVDVIVTTGTAVPVFKQATSVIPIVFAVANDPLGFGLVGSLSRPGGNVTGLSLLAPELAGKRLGLLREIVPAFRRLAILANADYSAAMAEMREVQAAARGLGFETIPLEVRRAEELAPSLGKLKDRSDAIYVCADALMNTNRVHINTLALAGRLPSTSSRREFVEVGGLMSYGPSIADLFGRAGDYVDKILRGAKPADLPVEQPTKFDLVINLTTARALGLTVPPTLLARADEVIE